MDSAHVRVCLYKSGQCVCQTFGILNSRMNHLTYGPKICSLLGGHERHAPNCKCFTETLHVKDNCCNTEVDRQ